MLAPAGFGAFGGDLLVGNFGDGTINGFNPTTGAAVGSLTPEYRHNRGQDTNDGFVNALYQDALGRAPDDAGRTLFDDALTKGATPGQVAGLVFTSSEYHKDVTQACSSRCCTARPVTAS